MLVPVLGGAILSLPVIFYADFQADRLALLAVSSLCWNILKIRDQSPPTPSLAWAPALPPPPLCAHQDRLGRWPQALCSVSTGQHGSQLPSKSGREKAALCKQLCMPQQLLDLMHNGWGSFVGWSLFARGKWLETCITWIHVEGGKILFEVFLQRDICKILWASV